MDFAKSAPLDIHSGFRGIVETPKGYDEYANGVKVAHWRGPKIWQCSRIEINVEDGIKLTVYYRLKSSGESILATLILDKGGRTMLYGDEDELEVRDPAGSVYYAKFSKVLEILRRNPSGDRVQITFMEIREIFN